LLEVTFTPRFSSNDKVTQEYRSNGGSHAEKYSYTESLSVSLTSSAGRKQFWHQGTESVSQVPSFKLPEGNSKPVGGGGEEDTTEGVWKPG
jgi:hypothetical protein